jgi:hypothetical protein
MPLALLDAQQPGQGFTGLLAALWPQAGAGSLRRGRLHWTNGVSGGHPGAMQQRPRSPHTPIRWVHQLGGLMAQVSRAERLQPRDDSLQARRLRQRMALAQRVLDPLPAPLRGSGLAERALWQSLRWGGLGLLLSLWLRR